jgi:hypothetical protein
VIYYLEKGEFVFVTAYTSAGKTVVAEYAFSLATNVCVPSAPLLNYVFFLLYSGCHEDAIEKFRTGEGNRGSKY